MKTFKRVVMSGNRDGYFSVVVDNGVERWIGPWPTRQHAEMVGKKVVKERYQYEKQNVARLRFNGE